MNCFETGVNTDETLAVPLKLRINKSATSLKSNNFYALTQHTREALLGVDSFGDSGSEGMGNPQSFTGIPPSPAL